MFWQHTLLTIIIKVHVCLYVSEEEKHWRVGGKRDIAYYDSMIEDVFHVIVFYGSWKFFICGSSCVFVRTYASMWFSYLSTFLCCFQYWGSHVCTCYIYLETGGTHTLALLNNIMAGAGQPWSEVISFLIFRIFCTK